jgi:hypothetical protein
MHDAYFSYWSAGYRKVPEYKYLLMQKIAHHFAKKYFNNVHLVTDSVSLPYLKKMEWTSVTTELDSLNPALGGIWSLGKIYAYKKAAEAGVPFIHIDYDVILWNGIPHKISNAEVFVQNEEPNSFENYEVEKFIENCPNVSYISQVKQNAAVNMGIFGGTNLNFIHDYCVRAIQISEDKNNYNFWTTFKNFYGDWHMATIVEQYFLVTMSIIRSQKITYLFEGGWPLNDNDKAKEYGYSHFMGDKQHKNFIPKLKQIAEDNCINIDI